ncbi:MAG: lipoate--protein ligase [Clostridia bacterium]|nr:lipoate--protein ligase [Clostridia bacterium]
MNGILHSASTDPYHNLALEELLFEEASGFCLYLWQNKNTVVIGRNQNPWQECRLELLEKEGGRLARRSSGGGAVFHDLGNLNFTFVTPREAYDLPRQLGVILSALKSLGIQARFTGRNDLVAENGAKFSGNAFRKSKTTCLHHGTLLVHGDLEKLSRYLVPSPAKLMAKGVSSVRSRVTNLEAFSPGLTIQQIREAVANAFEREYGVSTLLSESQLDGDRLLEKTSRYAAWDWNMGSTPAFDLALTNRFPWGELTLELKLAQGHITRVQAWSDAMDEALILSLPAVLEGHPLESRALSQSVSTLQAPEALDIARWLELEQF